MANVYYCANCGFRTATETGLKRSKACCGGAGFHCPRCPSSVMKVVGNTNPAPSPPNIANNSGGNGRMQGFTQAVSIKKVPK